MKPSTGLALAVAAALATAGAPAAHAATKSKACRLLTDDTDDAAIAAEPSHAPLDIVSGDVGTGTRNLVVVLRLKSLAADPALAAGSTYTFGWTVGGSAQSVTLQQFEDGSRVSTFDTNGSAIGGETTAKVLVDPATSSITWTIPRKNNPALRKTGVKFGGLTATTSMAVNVALSQAVDFHGSFSGGNGDSASSGKTYVDRAPTCLKGV